MVVVSLRANKELVFKEKCAKFLQQIITIEFEVLNEKRMIEVFN